MSLLFHPDRVPIEDREMATTKFQILKKVTEILLDDKRRKLYDKYGIIEKEEKPREYIVSDELMGLCKRSYAGKLG